MLAVVRTGAHAYGMNVRREPETVTGRSTTIGSVYATLDRLEAKGLVESWRAPATDASVSRRVFTVTSAGARSLALTRDTTIVEWRHAARARTQSLSDRALRGRDSSR